MEDELYFRRFHKFLARTNKHIQAVEWFHVHAEELRLHEVRSVLSVGAGSGGLDLEVLSYFPSLEKYVVVEPNQCMIAAFKQAAQLMQQVHQVSGGMLKDRNLDYLFVFECCKFEEMPFERFSELHSRPHGNAPFSAPSFDLTIMAHSIYYMDPQFAVLQAGLVTRKLIIFQSDVLIKIRFVSTGELSEGLVTASNTLHILKELAARPQPQSTATVPSDSDGCPTDRVRVNHIDTWQLPLHMDVKDLDDDAIGFVFNKLSGPEESEQLRQCLQRELPDGCFTHTTDVFVATFNGA